MKHSISLPLWGAMALALNFMCGAANARTDVTGMWFTCLPKELGTQNNPFELLRIKYAGKQIQWTSEWGAGFSASGRGFRQDDGLNLMGCHYLNGKVMGNCNVKNPPKHLFLAKPFFTAPPSKAALQVALASGHPIQTSAKRWDALALACEALTVQIQPKAETPKAASGSVAPKPLPPRAGEPRVNTAFPAYR